MSEKIIDVLLIEDNDGDAKLIQRYLESASIGLFFDEVVLDREACLEDGIECLESRRYDVVLLDLGLPESTGIETLERVFERSLSVPVIVLTGLDDPDVAVEAIHKGAQDYLTKGNLDSDRLVRTLRYAIERHRQERELERRTDQMDFFNSILRHDMLNGMNIITAESQMLAEGLDGEDAEKAEKATKIYDWSKDITDLAEKIRAILDTLTSEDDRDLRPVKLRPVVEGEADRARSIDDAVSVDVSIPDGTVVRADDLLEDVVGNLLVNAVEHAGPAVAIDVSAAVEENTVSLTVSDDGEAIPTADREAVFERGYKGAASGGTGFGLFFVDSMVESYDGTIDVGTSDRGGTKFRVELEQAA